MKVSHDALAAHSRAIAIAVFNDAERMKIAAYKNKSATNGMSEVSVIVNLESYPIARDVGEYGNDSNKLSIEHKIDISNVYDISIDATTGQVSINSGNTLRALEGAVFNGILNGISKFDPSLAETHEIALVNICAVTNGKLTRHRALFQLDLQIPVTVGLYDLFKHRHDIILLESSKIGGHIVGPSNSRLAVELDILSGMRAIDTGWLSLSESRCGVGALRLTHNIKSEIKILKRR